MIPPNQIGGSNREGNSQSFDFGFWRSAQIDPSNVIELTIDDFQVFRTMLDEPVVLTRAQARLGAIMRGES